MDEFDQIAWREFISRPFDPSYDWRAVAEEMREAAQKMKH